MGYWGEYVVVRSDRPALEIAVLSDGRCREGHEIGLCDVGSFGDGWQVLSVCHALPGSPPETVRQLGEETGAPALSCYILDDDTGLIHGWSREGGSWRTWFHPKLAADYEMPSHICYEDETGMPSTAYLAAWEAAHSQIVDGMPARATQMAAWATEAGWTPDGAVLLNELLSDEIGFAQAQFQVLLAAMGAPGAGP
ncbi:hypothetical protein [Yinghuangia soli]|uniref:Uncharacterized protein n=1 Tax=Yinghuangia soli TaxID=2908204 RepID=A0AA41Q055_9ACTN|nr:hypothetical protein [Yinghuangia soli]MCF2528881.1 hypothetical protein [Yinghuangia soli]